MKTILPLLMYLLTGGVMISSSDAIGSEQKIRSLFDIKYAFCSIKTNGVLGMDNRKSAYAGRGGGGVRTYSVFFF
ncbi:hypothetical protein [Escherichia coli]|uniref:hypothetical protein n=1 Tax=Escherichia coli TaxID=562 RepID=UPI0012FFB1C7|nr:hypothetical protein [Escherichia coli]